MKHGPIKKKRPGIVVGLILACGFPLAARASDFKILFSLGVNLSRQAGYVYHYSLQVHAGNDLYPAEYGIGNDRVAKTSIFAPGFGLGFSYKKVSVVLSVVPFTGNFTGTYDLNIPSAWYYNLFAADSIQAASKISGTSFGADIRYAVPLGRAFHIYGGAGVRFLAADWELPLDIVFMEYFYRNTEYSFGIHTLDITDVKMIPVAAKTLGWTALGGVEFMPAPPYRIFLEGRYQSGRADVPHPYYSRLDSTLSPIQLDFSGYALTLGIRYALDW